MTTVQCTDSTRNKEPSKLERRFEDFLSITKKEGLLTVALAVFLFETFSV